MNANALARSELLHIEVVLTQLETFPSKNAFFAASFIIDPEYWKGRILDVCAKRLDADIGLHADKLLKRLSAIT
jgi:hypothetical protein